MAASKYEAKLGPVCVGMRNDLVFTRHELSGKPKYVAHDPITFKNHAFNLQEYRILTAIVAERSLANTLNSLIEKGVLREQDNDAFYDFILALHGMNLLQLPISKADILFERYERRKAIKRSKWYASLFYAKIPVWNPDRFLARTVRFTGWLFSRAGVACWAALMLLTIWKCWGRLGEMVEETAGMLDLSNLLVMWFTLILLKVVHEFGHAYCCRRMGGEVPEMGLVFIVLTPCAYVDASSSWKFSGRWRRIAVGFAGMYIESIIAAVFALIWAATQPGFGHDLALNVVILAGAVTVLFNINPLMRFDGYYIFSDLCGVANLRERADAFLKTVVKRRVLGLRVPQHEMTRREKLLYGLYAPSSFVYKIVILVGITTMLVMQWAAGGVVLGIVFAWGMTVNPLRALFSYLWFGEETAAIRRRARTIAVVGATVLLATLFFLPISMSVQAPGVLEAEHLVSVRAPTDGFVDRVVAAPGSRVVPGDELVVLHNQSLTAERIRAIGELREEEVRLDATEIEEPTVASKHRARLRFLRERIKKLDERLASMVVSSETKGTVIGSDGWQWNGRFVRQGEEMFQVHSGRRLLRVVVAADKLARTNLVEGSVADVRWSVEPSRAVKAVVREIRPSASRSDVPAAVTIVGGGDVYARPDPSGNIETDQPYLHIFLEPDFVPTNLESGLTAHVRLHASAETLSGWIKQRVLTFYHAWRMS